MNYFTTHLCRADGELEVQVGYSVERPAFDNGFSGELSIDSVRRVPAQSPARERVGLCHFAIATPLLVTTGEENRQISDDAAADWARRRR